MTLRDFPPGRASRSSPMCRSFRSRLRRGATCTIGCWTTLPAPPSSPPSRRSRPTCAPCPPLCSRSRKRSAPRLHLPKEPEVALSAPFDGLLHDAWLDKFTRLSRLLLEDDALAPWLARAYYCTLLAGALPPAALPDQAATLPYQAAIHGFLAVTGLPNTSALPLASDAVQVVDPNPVPAPTLVLRGRRGAP